MRRLVRIAAPVLGLLVAVSALSACSENHIDKDVVRRAIANSRSMPRKFVYQDKALGAEPIQVTGLVEDDFRYAADLNVAGQNVRQEVVSDDALAIRIPDASQVKKFVDPAAATSAAPRPGEIDVSKELQVLSAGQWVEDAVGAPSLVVAANDKRKLGDDPIFDSLTVFDYIDKAVQASPRVQRYDPDSISPVFKTKEDPFPKPKRGAPLTRYDVAVTPLPKAAATGAGSRAILPDVTNFRKLVIYVKDGVVVRVMEDVDVASKLDDLKQAFKITGDVSVGQVVEGLNKVRTFAGQDPIRARTMSFEVQDAGAPEHVDLPQGAALGNLAVIRYRGKQAPASGATPVNAPTGGSGASGPSAAPAPVSPPAPADDRGATQGA